MTTPRAAAVPPPIRVVVVDDHAIVRSGLRAELDRHHVDVVAEAGTVEEAVAAVEEHRPDVLVLDVRLPGGGAPAVLRSLGEHVPPTLAVSASDERDDVIRTVRAGASGYLLKTAPITEIVAAIRSTHAGDPVFSAELAGHLLELDMGELIEDPEWEALTARERDVLRYLARGFTYKRIGEELFVGVKTVETHVRNTLRKLQLTNRHEAARWAIDRGFDAG